LVSTRFRVRRIRSRGQSAIDGPRAGRTRPLVTLAARFITAQAAAAAAIGLSYSRRHIPSIIITLMLVVALLGLAALARTGAHMAWLSAIGFESAFIMFGLIRFFSTRYLGGTLFGIITMGVLLHPAVARAFSGAQGQGERAFAAEQALSDAGADAPG
jgi:ribose/xylose/arabinose/galactoside ABC-type transport system permease subunit